jgi:ABC-type nitrate/sulfonate/bicarbonate transport system substrate-binding protein
MTLIPITIACGDYDRTRAIKDGRVRVEGCDVTYIPLEPEEVFHRTFKFQEFDVSELSFSSYLRITDAGKSDFVGIPAFVSRIFRHSGIYIRTDRGITKPEDLKGKRIGYGNLGALDHYSMMLFAEKMGWDPLRDISVFSSGNGPMPTLKGKVDAFFGTDIALEESKKLGLKDLLDLYQFRFAMPGSGVNAETGWLAKNREAAARFIKATVEAIAMLKTDKEAAFAAMTKWYGITDRAKQEAVLTQARDLPSKPYPSLEGLKKMQAVYNWREMTRHKLEDFYDASFVAALDKSGYIDGLYKTAAH